MKILVTGGTGTVGAPLVRALVDRGHVVRVLSRGTETGRTQVPGASHMSGDLATAGVLDAACRGMEKVYLLTPLSPQETRMGLGVVEAARRAGVRHLVFQSVHRAARAPRVEHFRSKVEIAEGLRASGLPWTVLSPNSFLQNDLRYREALLRHGVYPQPFGDIGLSRVDVRDIAEAAVRVLSDEGHEGEEYALVGPRAHTAEQAAETWARHLGREVRYAGNDLEAWSAQARTVLPVELIAGLRLMYEFFQQEGLVASVEELQRVRGLLGREPRSFEDFAAETSGQWTA